MYKHILLPTDGSDLSARAVKLGIAFAKSIGAKVTAFHARHSALLDKAVEMSRDSHVALRQLEAREAELEKATNTLLIGVKALAHEAGVACDVLSVSSDSPWQAIVDAANAKGCDLVFMASHGRRGIEALLLGSETTKVLTHSKIPVLVCR